MKMRGDPDTWDWGPPKTRPPTWPDDPDVRRAMEWFRDLIPSAEWKTRRLAHVKKLHGAHASPLPDELPHPFVADDDIGGWYLMLAEAFVDHIADYEPAQGSRVVPLFKVMGRDFDLLMSIEGVEERARRMLTTERGQPDGAMFELITALAYRRDGWPAVRFLQEHPGVARVPDFEVVGPQGKWTVECKRIGRSEYSRNERDQFWRLWRGAMPVIQNGKVSIFFDLDFRREVKEVPDSYLHDLSTRIIKNGAAITVDDEWATGRVSWTDLVPIQEFLKHDVVLYPSRRLSELLIGQFDRLASYAGAYICKPWRHNARYIDKLDVATIARWKCSAPASIRAKARHFLRQIADANHQLNGYGPSIIHIGLEVMEGSGVEAARRPRIMQMVRDFNPRQTDLHWIYIHYFVYESPPKVAWVMEETTDWFAMKWPPGPIPRSAVYLVIPSESETVPNPWDS